MKKLFGLFLLAVLFTFVNSVTYADDTGPPGIEETIEVENSQIENVLCLVEYAQLFTRGAIVFSPGDLVVTRYDTYELKDYSPYLYHKALCKDDINHRRLLTQLKESGYEAYTSETNLTSSQWQFKGRCTFN